MVEPPNRTVLSFATVTDVLEAQDGIKPGAGVAIGGMPSLAVWRAHRTGS